MSIKSPSAEQSPQMTQEEVRAFLKAHPDFLKDNPDLASELAAPKRNLGGGVVDFQQFLVTSLQKDSKELKTQYNALVDFCRDNMSVQAQVHHAALRLIAARSIEQLLEVLTLDLVSLFDVDVVRMAMESDINIDTAYGEQNYSGIVFIPPGTVDAALGERKNVLLVGDCTQTPPPGFFEIFADCDALIASCALLRLELETIGKNVVLAFGVRHAGRFHPGQGIELLHFLAQIVAHQMDRYLNDLTV